MLSIALILGGTVIVRGVSTRLAFNQAINNPAPVALPDWLASLPLTEKMTGKETASDFALLHDKQFPLTSGAVGIYGDRQATLWVAGTPLDIMAARMVIAMRDKIAKGGSLFAPLSELQDKQRTIYVLEGMGQKHFYFQSKNLVIWLAVDTSIAELALQQILEEYP